MYFATSPDLLSTIYATSPVAPSLFSVAIPPFTSKRGRAPLLYIVESSGRKNPSYCFFQFAFLVSSLSCDLYSSFTSVMMSVMKFPSVILQMQSVPFVHPVFSPAHVQAAVSHTMPRGVFFFLSFILTSFARSRCPAQLPYTSQRARAWRTTTPTIAGSGPAQLPRLLSWASTWRR